MSQPPVRNLWHLVQLHAARENRRHFCSEIGKTVSVPAVGQYLPYTVFRYGGYGHAL